MIKIKVKPCQKGASSSLTWEGALEEGLAPIAWPGLEEVEVEEADRGDGARRGVVVGVGVGRGVVGQLEVES